VGAPPVRPSPFLQHSLLCSIRPTLAFHLCTRDIPPTRPPITEAPRRPGQRHLYPTIYSSAPCLSHPCNYQTVGRRGLIHRSSLPLSMMVPELSPQIVKITRPPTILVPRTYHVAIPECITSYTTGHACLQSFVTTSSEVGGHTPPVRTPPVPQVCRPSLRVVHCKQ
jgi:hypothetical protein